MNPDKQARYDHALKVFRDAGLRVVRNDDNTGVIWVTTDAASSEGYRYQSTVGTWAHGPMDSKTLRNELFVLSPEGLAARIEEEETDQ